MELRISKQHLFIKVDVQVNEERESMQAMQRGEGCADNGEGKDDLVLAMVLIEDTLMLLLMIENRRF